MASSWLDFICFFVSSHLFTIRLSDHKGLSASDAGASARSRRVHQLHPVPVAHSRRHRLLHLQGVIFGLHGEFDAGSAGLPRRWLHHSSSLPYQHRNVPGHESQVGNAVLCTKPVYTFLFIYFPNPFWYSQKLFNPVWH